LGPGQPLHLNHVLVLGATGILTALCEARPFQKTLCQCKLPARNLVKRPRPTGHPCVHPRLPGNPGYKLPRPPSIPPESSVTSPANHEPVEWQAGRLSARVVAAFEFHAESSSYVCRSPPEYQQQLVLSPAGGYINCCVSHRAEHSSKITNQCLSVFYSSVLLSSAVLY